MAGSLAELDGGKLLEGTPKTRAGRRIVSIPPEIIPDLQAHLDEFAEDGPDGRVFVGPRGGPLRRSGFRRIWNKVRADVGLPDLHFHDLRHVGNTLAATTGASLKELMVRMGHASSAGGADLPARKPRSRQGDRGGARGGFQGRSGQ